MAQYLLLSFSKEVPNATPRDNIKSVITTHVGNNGSLDEFPISNSLAVFASMDQLMSVSDELVKLETQARGILIRTSRTIADMSKRIGNENRTGWSSLCFDQDFAEVEEPESTVVIQHGDRDLLYSIDQYLEKWHWDDAKFKQSKSINEITSDFGSQIQFHDDNLRQAAGLYNEAGSKLQALKRRGEGSLLVKNLDELGSSMQEVKTLNDYRATRASNNNIYVNTRNITTVLVVVKRSEVDNFLQKYETDREYVVPGSAQLLDQDNEFSCYAISMMRINVSDFTNSAKENGWHVRDFTYRVDMREHLKKEASDVVGEYVVQSARYSQLLSDSFSEVAQLWVHIMAIRVFVESTLMYGIPPNFQAFLVKSTPKGIPKIHQDLSTRYKDELAMTANDADLKEALGDDDEYYPYVCFHLNLLNLLHK